MEQQEITVYAAITISGPLVYHLIRWNVKLSAARRCTTKQKRNDAISPMGYNTVLHICSK
jgi:hypothetical protein